MFLFEYSELTARSTPYSSIRYSNCSFMKPTTTVMFVTPVSWSWRIVLSISGSPLTSRSALGVDVLIGTIRMPKPAARMMALRGALARISCRPLSVNCMLLSK